jgi:uncharacterized membrane protein YkoI
MQQVATAIRIWRQRAGSFLPALGMALVCVAGAAAAKEKGGLREAEPPAQSIREPARFAPAGISLDQVISQVEKRHKARVVKVDHQQVNGRPVYVLRLLSEDRVSTVRVDAETGKEI